MLYFSLDNLNKHGFFEMMFQQSILIASDFPLINSGNKSRQAEVF